MAAPAGNRFWEARSSHGRKPIFESPDDLWGACVEYFEWVEENPLYGVDVVKFEGSAHDHPVPKMRAMTIAGLCNFLDIAQVTWAEYRTRSEDFTLVTSRVDSIIRQQKFEGAAADLLNPRIIARDLGLAEKHEHSGPNGGPMQTVNKSMSAKEAAEAYQDSLNHGEG
ncbi:DNA-packaging protein [Henriciella aquimarina]|uniref:DNA-packaging protein n=1 Tax=Henriciella aquimarina TaxID=545261 RepID=UPI000A0388C2|nr:DNA-packaging protein [Henriciella aquimarina]